MKKKIYDSIVLCSLCVLLLGMCLAAGFSFQYFEKLQSSMLRNHLTLAASGVEQYGMDYLNQTHEGQVRITWIAADGQVLYDSVAQADSMENHGQREEVQMAKRAGYAESSRYSSTLTIKTLYSAMRLEDGSVLRCSISQETVFSLVLGIMPWLILSALLTACASYWIAGILTDKVVKPLGSLDLEHPLENDCYEELTPLLSRIYRQHEQIQGHLTLLRQKSDEFQHIIACMNEGLILLDAKGKIISMNPSACDLFDVAGVPEGKLFHTVDRSIAMSKAIVEATENGQSQLRREKEGKNYQFDISRIESEGEMIGLVLLVFDVSQQEIAERSRREFTANVSHELKTPLTTILASAELMENNLVKCEDMPRFVGHIRHEASRLLSLIEDIIRLSRLDEGEEMVFESVRLDQAAEDAVEQCRASAEVNGISLVYAGELCRIRAVPSLLHEIIYNLVENAIKYNHSEGSVRVSVKKEETGGLLVVEDTGIGIPQKYQERVFERFFRVDKSHSRQIGGTGLGLSIVKHAAACLNAEVRLESEENRGTKISVRFPLEAKLK